MQDNHLIRHTYHPGNLKLQHVREVCILGSIVPSTKREREREREGERERAGMGDGGDRYV